MTDAKPASKTGYAPADPPTREGPKPEVRVKLTERHWLAAGAAGLLAIALGAAAVALLTRGSSPQAPTAASQYTASVACLLTDSHGISAAPASTVWAGMEDAARATHAKATYLTVNGPDTAANAIPYASSLIEEHCNVVLAVGTPQAGALIHIATRNPRTSFVIVGSSTGPATANLKTISIGASTRSQVEQAVAALVTG
jgi:basic membrane lipoprotein Med (substrate-binding protein (PBP1-ABC) superfamily)